MIGGIKFSLFSPETIRKLSSAKIGIPDTYDDDSYPIDGGLVDPRMGVIDPGLRCKTCGGKIHSCPGHFAHIELVRPVVHPEFAKVMLYLLRSTCPSCKRVLLSEKEADETKDALEKDVEEIMKLKIKKLSKCPRCGTKLPAITLLKPTTFYKDKNMMLPTEVRDWLSAVSNEDLRLLGLDPIYARPEWMVLTALLVPPVSVRPSITLETGDRSEDDLTHKLVDIMRINQRLEANINAGAPQLIIEDLWELLQYHVTTYFNNETANIPPARHRSGRPLKTLSQRLKGKEGRFRYNLSGKRVNFSARTVISPDPSISINEVGVPMAVAEELTLPIKITSWNAEKCKGYLLSTEYPKARYVVRPDGKRVKVTEQTKDELAKEMGNGYVIERQLIDGDAVLFNRQPSLHRISIMCHKVRVLPGRTFRLHPCVCPPYNADYDGDEMNLHLIQNEEAIVEAKMLMDVQEQLISPRHGHAIIRPQEDYVSGMYFFTRDGAEFSKGEACNLMAIAGITKLPEPDKGKKYSGKLLFSLLLPKELSMTVKTKLDEYVTIKDGVLLSGAIESKAYESALLEEVVRLRGEKWAAWFLNKSSNVALQVISRKGLTVSLDNYGLHEETARKLAEIDDVAKREIDGVVLQYKNKTLQRMPGLTRRESLEERIMEITSKVREKCGNLVEKEFGVENPAILMAKIGARGSILNVTQMAASLGQQAVRGKRLVRGYNGRTLPHFKRGELGALSHGFVSSSFKTGLDPCEFFHHSMGGRESLVNTAIRTARSGYMQRRLINALQDFVVAKDESVRDARDVMVEFAFGGDGIDPMGSRPKVFIDEGPKKEDTESV
jgi:DNA-directed RNA polymerase subunit A'